MVDRAAEHEANELALAKATKLRRAGKPIPPMLARRAARAAKGMTRSSAEELADRYHRRRGGDAA